MKILKAGLSMPSIEELEEVAKLLRNGGLVIFPTETVYGVGVNAEHSEAIDRLYSVKNRPKGKPLSYHFADLEDFFRFAGEGIDEAQKSWFLKWLPNPLTIIYKDSVRQKKIGVRIPDLPLCSLFLKACGCPVMAPSANFSGDSSPKKVEDISSDFLKLVEGVIDGGPTTNMRESTVIDISEGKVVVLREGAFKI